MPEQASWEGLHDGARVLPVPPPHAHLHSQVTPTQPPARQQSHQQPARLRAAESARHRAMLWLKGTRIFFTFLVFDFVLGKL